MTTWPKDTMAAKVSFYGDPRGPHGVNQLWYSRNIIAIKAPWQMTYAEKPIKTFTFHKKAASALQLAMSEIWAKCGQKQSEIEKYGLQEFGGTFNYRLIRGSSNLSNHSFGIAIDIAPSGNALGVTKGKMPTFAVDAFEKQGFRWGGRYKGRKDWMHFEAVS